MNAYNPYEGLAVGPVVKKLTREPLYFGLLVGLANGAIATARGKKLTVRGTLATAAILALGEAALAADETSEERFGRPAPVVGLLSGVGVLGALMFFTDWEQWAGGDRPMLIAAAGPRLPGDREAFMPTAPVMTA